MKRFALLSAVVCLLGAGVATAGKPVQVKPWTYDPDDTGIITSAWKNGVGLPDAGKSNHGLVLAKGGATAVNAAAGATVTFSGQLTELGFDIRDDSHFGAGAPRFNVYTAGGTYYFFGAAYATEETSPAAGWTRLRFDLNDFFLGGDAFAANGTYNADDFNHVIGIDIVFDEGTDVGVGFAVLDNIDVNGTLVGKPGAAK